MFFLFFFYKCKRKTTYQPKYADVKNKAEGTLLYNSWMIIYATCCISNLRMIRDLLVVQPADAPKTMFFPHFCGFFCCCGLFGRSFGVLCRYMNLGSQCNPFWLLFIYVVSLFIGLDFFICSFSPTPLLGMIFGLFFYSAYVSDLCMSSEACWCLFSSSFVG